MNKMIIIGIACFVLAIAASTGVIVMTAKPKPAATADSTAVADTTLHAAAEGHGEAAKPAETADAFLDQPATEGEGGPSAMELAAAVPHAGEVVHEPGAPPKPADEPADFGRVGKILVNMKPAEAAAILSHLNDAQVEGVLRSLGPRQAATMLASLPSERAAALSRRLLVPAPVEKKP